MLGKFLWGANFCSALRALHGSSRAAATEKQRPKQPKQVFLHARHFEICSSGQSEKRDGRPGGVRLAEIARICSAVSRVATLPPSQRISRERMRWTMLTPSSTGSANASGAAGRFVLRCHGHLV